MNKTLRLEYDLPSLEGQRLLDVIISATAEIMVVILLVPYAINVSSFVHIMRQYISLHQMIITDKRSHRAENSRTSGRSRQFSNYIRSCRTDLLSMLSTDSATDIKCQG